MIQNIVIIGAGFVGTSLAVLLSQDFQVTIIDIDKNKLDLIAAKKSPISDPLIQEFLNKEDLNLITSLNINDSIKLADLIILSLPTNYDPEANYFDTSIIENVLSQIFALKINIPILIKSTVPIGFTQRMSETYKKANIIFSPEFLREGKALYDNLYPSRIVIGDKGKNGKEIADMFYSVARNKPDIYLINSFEAEAVKLFSNTYLANRVTFFNELDSFCLKNNLDSKSIIDGVSSDPRIGSEYNNPSFGYGGYCLPKDTKQLLANFKGTPQEIFTAIVKGNDTRKHFIAKHIIKQQPQVVGIYRLVMKSDSDNFRESAIFDILSEILVSGIKVIIFEPLVTSDMYEGCVMQNSLEEFKRTSELILANRMNDDLIDVNHKVFTRDIYGDN